jgi:hypothetical protein
VSRSGYSDDCENLALYRGAVRSAISGKRGQAFLREMATALDAMPEKALVAGDIIASDGSCCAIGAVALARGKGPDDVAGLESEDPGEVAMFFGVARAMAAEIEYENDECGPWGAVETPEQRWIRMRAWVDEQLDDVKEADGG